MNTRRRNGSQYLMRHRFWSWSVALASTFTTSGMIALPTDRIWAQETEKGSEETKAEEADKYDSAAFRKLLQTQKIDEAEAMIDAALIKSPNDVRLWQDNMNLIGMQLRSNRQASIQRGQSLLAKLESLETLSGQHASIYLTLLNFMGTASSDVEANLAAIDRALPKFEGSLYADTARIMKVNLLLRADRVDEAKSLLETALAAAGDSKDYLIHANIFLTGLARQFKDEAAKVEAKAMTIANQLVEGESIDRSNFMVYHMFMQGMARRNMQSQPEKSLEYVAAVEAVLEKAQKDETGAKSSYVSVSQNLGQLKASIMEALERSKLIGQPAKDYGDFAEHNRLIGMEDKSLADFKGKVVLLDFWAVFATFPHLKEWHEEYSEKGLVIIGATSYQNYVWNEETGKPVPAKEKVAAVEELKMLEKFRKSHGLHHGFLVTDRKKVNYGNFFMVSLIPQVVLIDKEGKIQMIRVGPSEQNVHDLQEKIEELLAQ